MIIVRGVFQAKYGKGGDLVALFKEAREKWPQQYADRILTDASGSFFTVVVETNVESLAKTVAELSGDGQSIRSAFTTPRQSPPVGAA